MLQTTLRSDFAKIIQPLYLHNFALKTKQQTNVIKPDFFK